MTFSPLTPIPVRQTRQQGDAYRNRAVSALHDAIRRNSHIALSLERNAHAASH